MQTLTSLFSGILGLCYALSHSYLAAILLFTLLTKVVLLPLSLWLHRNGIRMVELMPELNRAKVRYYGDRDAIAEETQRLYGEYRYHPLLSTVPMVLQILLLMGVVGAVKALLGASDSPFALVPVSDGGWTWLMPLLAGLAALALAWSMGRINPLQREQSLREQTVTGGVSVAVSLFLGAYVMVGVAVYWIAGNLFSILQQLLMNRLIKPEKYVDYPDLTESKKELAAIDTLSASVSPADRKREREDYKRFFSVANKHLVFYSEKSGFYKYFKNVIEYLLEHSNVVIHYVTSDPGDQIFEIARSQPRIRPYYIGEKRLITLFMKMDADIVAMTVPDLENYYLKRSYVRKDVEYVYLFHGLFAGMGMLRPGALDHFDTILSVGPRVDEEIRRLERENHTRVKRLVPCGYCVVDDMAEAYEALGADEPREGPPRALIAPSWQRDNVVENCLEPLCRVLLERGYDVTVRPHPQYAKRFPGNFERAVQATRQFPPDRFRWETDFSSNETVYRADLLITDWSSIGFEYALATRKPVLFINTPKKVVNPQCEAWYREEPDFDTRVRDVIGISLAPEEIPERGPAAVERLARDRDKYAAEILRVRQEELYHFGESGKYSAKYLLERLVEKKQERSKE